MHGAVELVHATAIALAGKAALIRGPSGSGKSDLAFRCLSAAPGPLVPEPARLVADDQVRLAVAQGRLLASAPEAIRGLIEVRGLGLIEVGCVESAEVRLVVELAPSHMIERLPGEETLELLGVSVPRLRVAPFEPSAPTKLLLALYRIP